LHVLPAVHGGVIGGRARQVREAAKGLQDPVGRDVPKQRAGHPPQALLVGLALSNGFHLAADAGRSRK